MIPTQVYIDAFRRITTFQIKYKKASLSQKVLAFLISWYIPTYLTHYTTIIGRSIYFPDEQSLQHTSTRFTIAHEVVHLLDQRRLTAPVFILLYLSPQIFALGVLSFPWLGYQALWFLIFTLPWPSPGRSYLEARAYGLELYLLTQCGIPFNQQRYIDLFISANYYFMSWSASRTSRQLAKYVQMTQDGSDPVLRRVVETFQECDKNGASD